MRRLIREIEAAVGVGLKATAGGMFFSAVLLGPGPVAIAAAADDVSSQHLTQAWGKNWNAHDMHAIGALVADFVNVAACTSRGGSRSFASTLSGI